MPLPPIRDTYFEDVKEGQEIPTVSIGPLTTHDFIFVPSAHHIWYTGHFDDAFARAQGMPDMFMHGYFYYGMWQRLLCNWGGVSSVPRRVKYRITRPTVRGHLITASGKVTGKRIENGERLVELDVVQMTQHGETNCVGNATVVLASREGQSKELPPAPAATPLKSEGTPENLRQFLGRESSPRKMSYPVEERAVIHYLESIQDGNPLYWSDEYAKQTKWGRRIAPWGAVNVLCNDHNQWRPDWMEKQAAAQGVMEGIPGFPTEQQANTDTEYWCWDPVYIGDTFTNATRLTGIVGPKTTRVGTGHFVTTEGNYINQNGRVCVRDDMTVYNYHRGEAAGYEQSTG